MVVIILNNVVNSLIFPNHFYKLQPLPNACHDVVIIDTNTNYKSSFHYDH